MPISNTYTEPTTGTALNTARGYVYDSMRAVLTNFKGPAVPTQLTADGVTIGEQDGMLYRSTVTNAIYISDSANKQNNNIGGGFTRWGIGHRIEPNLATLTTNAGLYEKGELVVTLDTGKLYVKNANANIIGSFYDVGNPTGYSVQGPYNNVNFTGQNVTAIRLLATSNVGINNGTPAAELDVVGSTLVSGTVTAGSVNANSISTSAIDYIGASWTTAGPSFFSRARRYIDNTTLSNITRTTRQSVSFLTPTFDASAGTNVHITDGSTVYIQGAPSGTTTNLIIDNSHALHIASGRTYLAAAGSATVPTLAINTQNTGIYSASAGTLNIATNGVLALTLDAIQNVTVPGPRLTVSGNVYTSNINFVGTSAIRGDFSVPGVTTTAATDTISAGAYTPSPIDGNMKTLSNTGAFTFNAPTASGDYTMVVQITNSATAGAITFAGFTKTQGSPFTTTVSANFLVFITKINSLTYANVVAL